MKAMPRQFLWGRAVTVGMKPIKAVSRPLLLGLVVIPFVAAAGVLFFETRVPPLSELADWFDPIFFEYNLLLVLFAVLLVPFVTYFYITNMKGEKQRRFRNELSETEWKEIADYVNHIFNRRFRVSYYLGSMSVLMVLITLGGSIILLLKIKPIVPFVGHDVSGVDYGKGANMLLLGPFIESFINGGQKEFYDRLVLSLTAFQFGFLGAYVYFIGYLTRSVFTLDLSPSTFVICSVRMTTGSLVALVISFVLAELPYFKESGGSSDLLKASLPLVSFFVGFFPSRGLLFISKLASRILPSTGEDYAAENLTKLKGMSYSHELRLVQEGYDNLENLALANPLDLALRTGFSFQQLRQWIGEAWLRMHMNEDYDAFVKATGITGAYELLDCKADWEAKQEGDFIECLKHAVGGQFGDKIRVVTHLFSTHLFAVKQTKPVVT